ncbi:translation initiation factor IF-2 [Mycoplasma sp. P36-A1]|uniref:translation initiation factor IF-2 n=1 Tax=Mycoplasma sp. P36-A1 TaxID=3252900 RepID=UPI003C302BF4
MAKKKRTHKRADTKLKSNIPTNVEKHQEEEVTGVVYYEEGVTLNELAAKLKKNSADIIKLLFMLGHMATINSSLSDEMVELIAMEYGIEVEKHHDSSEIDFEDYEIVDEEKDLQPRSPIITIMGHVDHGKTTLLDAIRKTKVIEGEFGGITQHIGAYQVEVQGQELTFLDTPGHEAFTAMRARGASVTDIVIIVVAADDGVMPQTVEAIDHAKAAGVPIVVAVNKMDKEGANPERVMSEMSEYGLMPEAWGGDVIYKEIAAKPGIGIEELLETLLIVAELSELKANPNRYAYGTVIEAKLDKGKGVVSTLLVQNGTLRIGDPIVVGNTFGRVRQMYDDLGKLVKEAGPSMPVEITGLNDVPEAGEKFMAFETEKQARSIGEKRYSKMLDDQRRASSALSLDDLSKQIQAGEVKEINVIIKADVSGSAEAIKATLAKLDLDGVKINVVRSSAGAITESDVLLAQASGSIIYGFNVRPIATVKNKAEEEGVQIRLHNVIYKIVEELEDAMKGMLDPDIVEKVTGQAEVRQTFKVSKVGTIAGCYVTDGKIVRDSKVRLIREGVVVFDGELASLKRFKDEVKEVASGYECGITIENFNDIKEGDILEGYIMEEVAKY